MARKRTATVEAGFLSDICAHPADDAPRLVYADWLEENGQPERAEFIRLQVRLANTAEDDPERDDLADREWELLLRHGDGWRQALPAWVRKEPHEFRRGFVASVSLTATQFLRQGAKLLRSVPLEGVHLRALGHAMPEVAASPLLAQVTSLDLSGNELVADDLKALFASPHLGSVTGLVLRRCNMAGGGPEAVARWPGMSRLISLDIGEIPFGYHSLEWFLTSTPLAALRDLHLAGLNYDALGRMLASNSHLGSLQRLSFDHCNPDADTIRDLGRSAFRQSLTSLDLNGNALNNDTVRALADSPLLPRLSSLDLSLANRIGADLADLFASIRQGRLRKLVLRQNRLDAKTLASLHLSSLWHLDFWDTGLTTDAAVALAENPNFRELRYLDLSVNPIGNEGACALAESENLSNLRTLKLNNTGLSQRAVECLRTSPHLSRLLRLEICGNRDLHGRIGERGCRESLVALLETCFWLPRLVTVEGNEWGPPFTLVRPAGV